MVCFIVERNREGMPQARCVKTYRIQGLAAKVNESVHDSSTYAGDSESESHISDDSCQPDTRGRFRGNVKSYSVEKGFGFIDNEALRMKYGYDVYVHHNQWLAAGCHQVCTVEFDVHVVKGKPQARNLQVITDISCSEAAISIQPYGASSLPPKVDLQQPMCEGPGNKKQIGELLYAKILKLHPSDIGLACQITGMILENPDELVHSLIESDDLLTEVCEMARNKLLQCHDV